MNKLLSVLTILAVFLGLGISCAAAANVVVSFNPQAVDLHPGSSHKIQILMSKVPDTGLAGFNLTVSVADPTITTITDVSAPSWAGVSDNSSVPASSVWIKAVDLTGKVNAGDTNVSLGNITVTGMKEGAANLNIVLTELTDLNGDVINSDVAVCIAQVSGNGSSSIPVANFNSNVTSGYAPLSVQFTDTSQNAAAWSWNFGDEINSIEQNPEHTYSSAGTFNVSLTVSNAKGAPSTKTATITVQSQGGSGDGSRSSENNSGGSGSGDGNNVSSSSGGSNSGSSSSGGSSGGRNDISGSSGDGNGNGGSSSNSGSENSGSSSGSENSGSSGGSSSGGSGGGGAGGSPEPQSNVEAKELSQTFITSGNSTKFDFPRNATPVVYVNFDSKKTAGKTTAVVEMLKGKSTLVTELPSGEIYKSLNIWIGNGGFGESDNIENAVVYFKVEKSWIQDKNIDKSSITLNRYSDEKWDSLTTTQSGEDDKYLYYTAKTPGFSPFVITGKKVVNGAGMNPGAENVSGNKSTKIPGFEAAGGIICLLAVFLLRRK